MKSRSEQYLLNCLQRAREAIVTWYNTAYCFLFVKMDTLFLTRKYMSYDLFACSRPRLETYHRDRRTKYIGHDRGLIEHSRRNSHPSVSPDVRAQLHFGLNWSLRFAAAAPNTLLDERQGKVHPTFLNVCRGPADNLDFHHENVVFLIEWSFLVASSYTNSASAASASAACSAHCRYRRRSFSQISIEPLSPPAFKIKGFKVCKRRWANAFSLNMMKEALAWETFKVYSDVYLGEWKREENASQYPNFNLKVLSLLPKLFSSILLLTRTSRKVQEKLTRDQRRPLLFLSKSVSRARKKRCHGKLQMTPIKSWRRKIIFPLTRR